MNIGFCGLGGMGTTMVRRPLAVGHQVAVWNRTEAKLAPAIPRARLGRFEIIADVRAAQDHVANQQHRVDIYLAEGCPVHRTVSERRRNPMPVTGAVLQALRMAALLGLGNADLSRVVQLLGRPAFDHKP